MNDTLHPASLAVVPWLMCDPRVHGPVAAKEPGPEQAPPATPEASTRERARRLRTAVRRHPLVAVAGALALGAAMARVVRA